jgi:hypothetical protein
MDTMIPGSMVTLWSVRAAGLCYVVAIAAWIRQRPHLARIAWTISLGCYLCHVAAAFGFYHGWSHQAAYRETARQTAALFGMWWGGGLYFNYLFTLVWALDVVWLWRYRKRPRWIALAVHTFMAFLFFNATVVFASGWIRWSGVLATLALALLWFVSRRHYR